MPIFEYECGDCGHHFEQLVLPSLPAPECPSCHEKNLKQLISLCGMSSDTSRQANLNAAHKKAGAVRKEKQHENHRHLHEHFD